MSEAVATGRRKRSGGGAARRATRAGVVVETARPAQRAIPVMEMLDERTLARIEVNAETLLAEIGVSFVENPEALERWRAAGAEVDGERVRLPPGLARELIAQAPARFVQVARNPRKSVEIGGDNLVCAPVYGPPFVHDRKAGRRYATIEDFRDLVRLGQMSKWLHHSGGTVCEPTDLPVASRHLDMLHAHMTLSDKPFMGSVTEPSRARDSVAMCEILFGERFVAENTVLTSLINVNSPLTFDSTMAGALEVYAAAGQAVIVSPFVIGGAMAPVSVMGTLTQVLAEVMAGIAYAQLVRPGAPAIFGAFVATIDMTSGAPTFGTPEASQIVCGAGQLARRLGLPFRSGGGLTGAKLADAQAGYEAAQTMTAAALGGVNFMLHSCGWLEGGLVASPEKFVMDADQLGALHRLLAGVPTGETAEAMDALREVGPGGHYLGCAHTQANFESAFWRSELLDNKSFEAWAEAGSRDTATLAAERADRLRAAYTAPPLDSATTDALSSFVAERKARAAVEGG